jgi:cation-transporting ATPase E
VVLDDIIGTGPGDQIVVDGDIVEKPTWSTVALTGEADLIAKDTPTR